MSKSLARELEDLCKLLKTNPMMSSLLVSVEIGSDHFRAAVGL